MKKIIFLFLTVLLFGLFINVQNVFAQVNNSKYQSLAIEKISIVPQKIYKICKMNTSFYVKPDQLNTFSAKFGSKVKALKNDKISCNSKFLQINYVEGYNPVDANKIYMSLVKIVGKYNTIVRNGNVVVEIISDDPALKKTVANLLSP